MKRVRKVEKMLAIWTPRVQAFLELDPRWEYCKCHVIIGWMSERYVTFRAFKPLYKKIVVGKCLNQLKHTKHSKARDGWIYRRGTDVIQGLPHIPDVSRD